MSHAQDTQILQLDAPELALGSAALQFFADQTGIHDEPKLREHILAVQHQAWKVFHYHCIRNFGFLNLKISRLPAYPDLLKLGKERPAAIFLDFACCFGNDARKAIADGYPIANVLASDLHPEFWALGHTLFRSTHESFPVPFVGGDVFSDTFISPSAPISPSTAPTSPPPELTSLTSSLDPLKGQISALHVSSFFHLFNESQQITAARKLASLLSPEPGSIIFGSHGTQKTTGVRQIPNLRGETPFCYAGEDWVKLWDGEIFPKGTVKVEYELRRRNRAVDEKDDPAAEEPENERFSIAWCVTRL